MSPASRRSSAQQLQQQQQQPQLQHLQHQQPQQPQQQQQQQVADHYSSSVNPAFSSQHRGHTMLPSNQLSGLVHCYHHNSSSIPSQHPPAEDSSPSPLGSPTLSSLPHPNANDNLRHLHPHPPSLPPGHLKQQPHQQQNRRSTHSHNSSPTCEHYHADSDIHHSSRSHTRTHHSHHTHSYNTLPPFSSDSDASKLPLQPRQSRRQNKMDTNSSVNRLSTHDTITTQTLDTNQQQRSGRPSSSSSSNRANPPRHSSSNSNMNPNPESGTSSLVGSNPYWLEYHQASDPPVFPLNYYKSPSQHQHHVASIAPMGQGQSFNAAEPVLAPAEPARKESQQQQQQGPPALPSSKILNQNQVHAQRHPWRIKVYNACLACRKKKIKCDGQPTCQRCQRLGFECSYIEVPQATATKVTKPKTNKNAPVEETPAPTPSSASTKMPSKRHHHHTNDPPSTFHPPSNSAKATKELRQQRRSSTKDAASGSFPHSTPRRKDALPAKDPFIDQPMMQQQQLQQQHQQPLGPPRIPTKDQQRSPLDMGAAPSLAKPLGSSVLDRDTTMPDLYHILVNSVTIPNVSKYTQATQSSILPTTGPGGGAILMGMDQLNLTLASPVFPTFTVLNSDHTDPDQHQSAFQKDPTVTSFLDQSTPLGFVITNKSVIQYLVHVYFECFHHHWMIVDKQKFLAQLKDPASPPDPLLLVAICAAGAKYSDHEGLCAEPGNLSTIGEQFLTHARILLQDRFDMPSMSTLQALLILYWCQVQTGRASLRFMYVGMAIRMAQEIGLNRPLDPKRLKDMDEREIQIRKTIWWSCYQADRWTSAALGKPMVCTCNFCSIFGLCYYFSDLGYCSLFIGH